MRRSVLPEVVAAVSPSNVQVVRNVGAAGVSLAALPRLHGLSFAVDGRTGMSYNCRAMAVQLGSFDSDGATLRYLDWGGDGPPLILIHATGFLAALWRPIAERLSARFRVVAMDQRGHGQSDKPPDGYHFDAFADDLQSLIDALDLESPMAAGHSSGATTIVVHAARHPGVIRRAVLIEPILPSPAWYESGPERTPNTMAEGARKRRAVWPSRDELFDTYRTRPAFQTWQEEMLRLYVDEGTRSREDGQVELLCPPELEAQFFEAVTHVDSPSLLPKLACPSLVLWGAEGDLRERTESIVAEGLPDARTVVVPKTTHFLPQERPDEVGRLIEEFLSD